MQDRNLELQDDNQYRVQTNNLVGGTIKQMGFLLMGIVVLIVLGGGYYLFRVRSLNYSKTQNQNVIPTQSQISQDETVNWKTFTNIKYGYQIKYPKDWYVSGSDAGDPLDQGVVIFITKDKPTSPRTYSWPNTGILVRIFPGDGTTKTAAEIASENASISAHRDFTPINIGTIKAFVTNYNSKGFDNTGPTFHMFINGWTTTIATWITSSNDRKIINKIVSTLKLTASAQTNQNDNWKVYTNSDYNFSLKYPPQFAIHERKEKRSDTTNYDLNFANTGNTFTPNSDGVLEGIYKLEIGIGILTSNAKTIEQYERGLSNTDVQITSLSDKHGADEAAEVAGPGGSEKIYRFGNTFFFIGIGYYDAGQLTQTPDNSALLNNSLPKITDSIQFNANF